ncbi:MAG TPA: D-aminoacyl-tRNA deacylase [Bryobacteraceae bacterium]|nr:D-aminoacyl-tRNA deacylase [Bryobacteraceae bacterium]
MRAVVQRVSQARVEVDGAICGEISAGLLVLLGIEQKDTTRDADFLAGKVLALRIFADPDGRMNRSVLDVGGGLLVVSQFTLYGDTRKGTRPSFDRAAKPEQARPLYEYFVDQVKKKCETVATGVFQSAMSVYLVNDGPVTLICDSARIPE